MQCLAIIIIYKLLRTKYVTIFSINFNSIYSVIYNSIVLRDICSIIQSNVLVTT